MGERKMMYIDKDNLNGPYDELQINRNWIWKKLKKLRKMLMNLLS